MFSRIEKIAGLTIVIPPPTVHSFFQFNISYCFLLKAAVQMWIKLTSETRGIFYHPTICQCLVLLFAIFILPFLFNDNRYYRNIFLSVNSNMDY